VVLRGFVRCKVAALLAAVQNSTALAPLRNMITPGGLRMSVAMTNCGRAGWVTDRRGYRYEAVDPMTGRRWPPIPGCFRELSMGAADAAGFAGFEPDACLINRYAPGTRLSLHRDENERDLSAPIVSVSLGLAGGISIRRYEPWRPAPAHSAGERRRCRLGWPGAPDLPWCGAAGRRRRPR